MENGLLRQCRTAGCGWKCCNFGKEGYIILLPDEYEQGVGDKSHLSVIDSDYFGGKKVKCIASDCEGCDKGYKPIMCRTYPYWMRSLSKDIMMRSKKCYLDDKYMAKHREYVRSLFKPYKDKEGIDRFLNAVHIDRYFTLGENVERTLTKEHLDEVLKIEKAGFGDNAYCFSSEPEDIKKSVDSQCSSCVTIGGELLGYSLAYYSDYGTGYIEKCYVKEKARGLGFQKIMIEDNLKKLVSHGVSDVYSMCSPQNVVSLENFCLAGFKVLREVVFQGAKRLILKWSLYESDNR